MELRPFRQWVREAPQLLRSCRRSANSWSRWRESHTGACPGDGEGCLPSLTEQPGECPHTAAVGHGGERRA